MVAIGGEQSHDPFDVGRTDADPAARAKHTVALAQHVPALLPVDVLYEMLAEHAREG
jgi:hypothetical protein